MLNNEMKQVSVVSFTTGTDEYGRKRQNGSTLRYANMVIKVYRQTNTSDVRYIDADYIGVSADAAITTSNRIVDGANNTYEVLQIVPSKRYTQYLLKKV